VLSYDLIQDSKLITQNFFKGGYVNEKSPLAEKLTGFWFLC